MRIFLAADGSAGLKVARLINQTGHEWVGVAAPKTSANSPLLKAAEAQSVAIFEGKIVKDEKFADWIKRANIDVILSIHTSYIMHDKVILAAGFGSFNLHPGPLPDYAGRNPVSWALYHGEAMHGATLHRMTSDVDGGAIVGLARFAVNPGEIALELMAKTSTAGVNLVRKFFEQLAAGDAIDETPQDPSKGVYFDRRVPQDGMIDWSKSAEQIVNFVRAADFGPFPSPWGYPQFVVRGKKYRLLKAEVSEREADANPGSVCELATIPLANASDRQVKLLVIDPPYLTWASLRQS